MVVPMSSQWSGEQPGTDAAADPLQHRYVAGDPDGPVFLALHATGGTPHDLLSLARILDDRGAVLAPVGPVSERGLARWFRRYDDGTFDVGDVVARTDQLADFVLTARRTYDLTGRRFIGIGFSNGADIAAALLLLRPDVLTEAVLFGAMLPVPDPPRCDLTGSRAFMAIGDRDPIAARESADLLLQAVLERGAEATAFRHEGGHKITAPACRAAKAWFRRG
jgi:phospholipase/carboxylesterase